MLTHHLRVDDPGEVGAEQHEQCRRRRRRLAVRGLEVDRDGRRIDDVDVVSALQPVGLEVARTRRREHAVEAVLDVRGGHHVAGGVELHALAQVIGDRALAERPRRGEIWLDMGAVEVE